MAKTHEGYCGQHSSHKTLASKILRVGYYWPTIKIDTTDYVQRCLRWQKLCRHTACTSKWVTQLASPWPFLWSGVNILGPFPRASGQVKYLVMVANYLLSFLYSKLCSLFLLVVYSTDLWNVFPPVKSFSFFHRKECLGTWSTHWIWW